MAGRYVSEVFALCSVIEDIKRCLLERYQDIWLRGQDAGIAARGMLQSIEIMHNAAKDTMVYAAELDEAERRSSEAPVEEKE